MLDRLIEIDVGLALNGLVAGLLVVTIIFCVRLQRRLSNFRSSQSEMKRLIAEFSTATTQARAGVDELKAAAEEIGQRLNRQVDEARAAADNLRLMNVAGDKIAARLNKVGHVTARTHPTAEPAPLTANRKDRPAQTKAVLNPKSERERDLLQALRQAR